MESKLLSRSYLETLSSADLVSLAETYGIDIPDDLSRKFVIGELLEFAEEMAQDNGEESRLTDIQELSDEESESIPESLKSALRNDGSDDAGLPFSFNETEIGVVFKNPVWLYVYWDIKASDLRRLGDDIDFEKFVVRVSYFDAFDSKSPTESFDVQVSENDRDKFIMLSANKPSSSGKRFVRVDLVAAYSDGKTDNLAISKKTALPCGSELLGNARPGRDVELPPVMELSGIRKILHSHYEVHRESFA
ncbi:DUF4912 domain-containing protein [Treponema saccharophilum]|uniref:DUF4912 domain-containing protein n=1 Tax=Treponema saccharophilum DSM 2985 TaxID=907348 RepID=H7EJX8_9SPIR|nr:DUF4912 domain-containing protein [Treponema saccharophilum]EIC02065.1 hypothetical protein TresaDRAFT_1401 [Treponema saccharophilum DSM 2985]BDC96255.1 hypothetical protein TRSA_13540 [Treponema saccharophilum]